MPIAYSPGALDFSGLSTAIGALDPEAQSDSFTLPGLIFPNQQLTVTVVTNYINGGSSPTITYSIDQLNPNGEGWTSIWNSGPVAAPGTVGPTVVNPPGGSTAFAPSILRMSWTTTGQPTEIGYTPTITAT